MFRLLEPMRFAVVVSGLLGACLAVLFVPILGLVWLIGGYQAFEAGAVAAVLIAAALWLVLVASIIMEGTVKPPAPNARELDY